MRRREVADRHRLTADIQTAQSVPITNEDPAPGGGEVFVLRSAVCG